jgi:hypothetical protein|tara:strand:+ start:287 stop:571 length:285 start_codon:yes stop_codon:yes gene_type:complete
MAKKIDEGTQITLDLKTIGILLFFVATVVGMWFSLNASIDEARELPVPPDPEVSRMEFDMKDQMIRQTIMTTQGDVTEIKEDLKRIEEKLDDLK